MSTAITPVQRYDRQAGPLAGLTFESYLYNWSMYIRAEMEYSRPLAQAATTLHIRSRGITIDDMVGYYGTTPQTAGRWLNYDANLDGSAHPINIVGPAFATNKNACLQSNSQTSVTSANASAQHKQIAMRWQKVCDYFERVNWNEPDRAFIFDDIQKGGTELIDTVLIEMDKQAVPTLEDDNRGVASYKCESCGSNGIAPVDNVEQEGEGEIPCPQCQAPAIGRIQSLKGKALGESDVPTYDIRKEIISFFNFTIDLYGAKVGGLNTAGWLQIQRLRDLIYMQTHYPDRPFTGPSVWSYTSRCDYALSRGRWDYLNYQPRESAWGYGHERYEEKAIYLHEDSYKSFRANADYEFVNKDGQRTFKIKKGQTIGEAQEALYGENCRGFKFVWSEDMLLDIPSPEVEELNFRERFSDVHWSRESGAYLSSPNYSIVYIQDDITLLNTLNHNIIARNAVNPVFYDSTVFEQTDFSKEFIPTKNAALLADGGVKNYVTSLPIPTPSPYLSQQMQWLWGIKDSVSQVTPAMRGEQDRGAPYAAQRQQLEQSYGNLTSVLKSFAQCKTQTFRNQARLAKKKWTLEQFQRVGSMWGEIWTEEDVEEMCQIDFDRDLVITYEQGSEMPSTPMAKEMKFFGALQQLMPFVQANPQIIGTDKFTQILQKIDEFGEIDFDLTGLEVDELIAQKRYNDLATACLPYQGMSFDEVDAAKQQVVSQQPPDPQAMEQAIQTAQAAPDDPQAQAQAKQMATPTPITAMDLLTEKIFHESGIRFSQYEDLSQQKGFFVEMLRGEIGKTKPNYVLIEMMTTMLGLLDQAIEGQQEKEIMSSPQAKAAAAADAATKDDRDKQMALEAAKINSEVDKNQADVALKTKELEIKAHQGDRDALLEAVKDDPAPEQHHVSESMTYKDAPPSIRRQMEEQAGMTPATQEESKVELDAKKQEAKPKPAPVAKPREKK
jgi:hypothetical protein